MHTSVLCEECLSNRIWRCPAQTALGRWLLESISSESCWVSNTSTALLASLYHHIVGPYRIRRTGAYKWQVKILPPLPTVSLPEPTAFLMMSIAGDGSLNCFRESPLKVVLEVKALCLWWISAPCTEIQPSSWGLGRFAWPGALLWYLLGGFMVGNRGRRQLMTTGAPRKNITGMTGEIPSSVGKESPQSSMNSVSALAQLFISCLPVNIFRLKNLESY